VFVDYFKPSFWNNLSVEDKALYIQNGVYIGMPPANLCKEWTDVVKWKGLNREQMKEKYGRDVLKDYVIPTASELRQLQENLERRVEEAQAACEQCEEVEIQEELGTTSQ